MPQLVPRTDPGWEGFPSIGYMVRFYNGDPNAGGTEIPTTQDQSGAIVGWWMNFGPGAIKVASSFTNVTDPGDIWMTGFRYTGDNINSLLETMSAFTYKGTWNADTNVPAFVPAIPTNNGEVWIVSAPGITNVDGETGWEIGDWRVSNGTIWQKIDQSYLKSVLLNRDPDINDDGIDSNVTGFYIQPGFTWLNSITNDVFICRDSSTGAAVWLLLTPDLTIYSERIENVSDPTQDNDIIDTAGLGRICVRGDLWINTTTEESFICVNDTATLATWQFIGAGGQGLVYINDIVPNGGGNVGDKNYLAGSNNEVLIDCSADDMNLRVYIIAMIGESNLRPIVNVNGTVVGNWDYVAYETDNRVLFRGYADILLVGTIVTVTHEDGAITTGTVAVDAKPAISVVDFVNGYPGVQTELKAGDNYDIRVVADLPFVNIEVEDSGACVYQLSAVASGIDRTITATIADRGVISVARPARCRVQKASGTWSDWVYTNFGGGTVDGSDLVFCNNLYPSVDTMNQANITYPALQEAIKGAETVTIHSTCTDFDTILYNSPNGDLSIPNTAIYQEDKLLVQRIAGSYNISTINYRINCNRIANDATTIEDVIVYIANVAATLTVTEPASRLRSGGNDGTSAQNHTITITASQNLISAPTLGAGAEGIWQGGGFTGATTVWTRALQINDNMTKGTYAWGSISGTNLAGIVTSIITGDLNYILGGFVSRVITLAAFANEANMNVEAITYANVAMTWNIKALPNKRAIGTTAIPDANSWCLHTLSTNPTIIRILDTAATDASSSPSTITIEETI